jgi:hypothetical protein
MAAAASLREESYATALEGRGSASMESTPNSCRSEPPISRESSQDTDGSLGLSRAGSMSRNASLKKTPSALSRLRRRGRDGEHTVSTTSPIAVPTSIKTQLAYFRKKRKENMQKEITLSNLLSVSAVQREMHMTDIPGSPQSLSRQRSAVTTHAEPPPSLERGRVNSGSCGLLQRGQCAVSAPLTALGQMLPRSTAVRDPLGEDEAQSKVLTYVTPEVNKKIRMQLLKQVRTCYAVAGPLPAHALTART